MSLSLSSRTLAITSATLLIAASAGFGAVYAWSIGSRHGPLLGVLMVAMALGLELAKPLALELSIAALRSFALFRALALGCLCLVAVAYSLTAELSLVATLKADQRGSREVNAELSKSLQERATRTKTELASLPMTLPAAALEARANGLRSTPGFVDCAKRNDPSFGPISRRICGELSVLHGQIALAERRAALSAELLLVESRMERAAGSASTSPRDPAASVIATTLAALGLNVSVGALSDYLTLIPVLALELGSTLAVVLARWQPSGSSRGPDRFVPSSQTCRMTAGLPELGQYNAGHAPPPRSENVSAVQWCPQSPEQRNGGAVPLARDALLDHLRASGGRLNTQVRALAATLGVSPTRCHQVLRQLAGEGLIYREASRSGIYVALL